jgi:hypothetical protein
MPVSGGSADTPSLCHSNTQFSSAFTFALSCSKYPRSCKMDSNAASQLDELCRSAFVTECLGDFPRAIQQHEEALKGLTKLAESNTSSVDMGQKETARKQLESHLARLQVLRQRVDSATEGSFVFSPTSFSAQQELATSPTLSLVSRLALAY